LRLRAFDDEPPLRTFFGEALGYLVASGAALICDMTLLWSLVTFLRFDPLLAACLSFVAGICIVYALSVCLVFQERRLTDRRVEFLGFAALGMIGLAVNTSIMFITMKYLGIYYLVAKCIAASFTFVCNFISRRQLLFVRNRPSVRSG
jgi:putative flippase GtrA